MSALLIRKLEQFTRLSADEKLALEAAASQSTRQLGAREDIFREGDAPRHVNLVLDGWLGRYKVLEDGGRQIITFLIPGDLCDARLFILERMDHSVGTLSPATIAEIPPATIMRLTDEHPRLARAFWWSSLVEEAINREWIVNLGRRDAFDRMAHLFCELFIRMRAVGLTNGTSCEMPLTQAELGDALGISAVHVNRTLMDLREAGLIALRGKLLDIPDLDAAMRAASFDPSYLHLDREGAELDANQT